MWWLTSEMWWWWHPQTAEEETKLGALEVEAFALEAAEGWTHGQGAGNKKPLAVADIVMSRSSLRSSCKSDRTWDE